MFYIRKPKINVQLEDYKDALYSSLLNEDWVYKAYNNETNIMQWLNTSNPVLTKKAINEYKKTKDIASLIKAKNQVCFSDQAIEMIFEAGKSKTNVKLAEMIFNKTSLYANATKYLFYEYCENTGEKLNATIMPFPKNIEETTKPISTFCIKNSDETIFYAELKERTLEISSDNKKFEQYFENRQKSKDIKKRFLQKEQLSDDNYKACVRDLINLKESPIPVAKCFLTSENCDFKILYRGNQTFSDQLCERTLTGCDIKVLSITKIK